jgi:hypothetical protein
MAGSENPLAAPMGRDVILHGSALPDFSAAPETRALLASAHQLWVRTSPSDPLFVELTESMRWDA